MALDASARLSRAGVAHRLSLHGGTDHQARRHDRALPQRPARRRRTRATAGPYRRAEMAGLVAGADWVVFPSEWWENAPLVINEAFLHRRPVICSAIGGAAELVQDGVNGLHVRVGDGAALAAAMRRGVEEPGLWERLVTGIEPPPGIDDTAAPASHALRGAGRATKLAAPEGSMSAVLDTRPVRAAIAAARPLEVVASWRVLPGALMVLGWSTEPLPATGAAQVERVPGSRGVFRALCWAGSRAGDGHVFLAAIRLPDRADPADGATIQLRGAEGGVLLLALPQAADADAGSGSMSRNSPAPPRPRWRASCSTRCGRPKAATCRMSPPCCAPTCRRRRSRMGASRS